ncbi:outer membrane beta-barrel protein [Vibrio ziniensis]|uniref:Porin family protein n=1 Tax=Vibrio ziniensis TaxID=2711221 RepID=A0A6G7CNN6_9VIBR|nr:outer membrane beta-barrel protein [Vibrio ziniensis]QIH43747.1 porin family protein [Vibrio ziniensis]
MKLNHVVVTLAVTLFSSSVVWADNQSTRGFYLGGDWGLFNNSTIETDSSSITENSDFGDFGYGFMVGYEFNTHRLVKLGLEAEYRSLATVSQDTISTEADGVFFNVKPKFIVEYDQADIYLSLLAGLGNLDVTTNTLGSDSELAYQVGAELGVIVNRHLDLHLGYRNAQVTFDDADVSFGSIYTGVRYFF